MRISEIVKLIEGNWVQKTEDQEIAILNFDSRKSTPHNKELFFALTGPHQNGHAYLPDAHKRGVRNFVVSQIPDAPLANSNIIVVSDTLISLQQIATYHRNQFQIPVVGITGSNGKTIVKEWLSTILSEKWQVVKSPKSYNSQIGVPLSIWQIDSSHQIGVFEAGISSTGEMAALGQMIQPELGIFTNIGEAHNSGFASLEEKILEKCQLFKTCKTVICPYSQDLIAKGLVKNTAAQVITWGIQESKASISFIPEGTYYSFIFNGQSRRLKVNLRNPFDLENLFNSVVAALVLGMEDASIQLAINKLKAVPMRLEIKKGKHNCYLLDDTYNNDLIGLSTALDYLLQQPHKNRKTVILSDILQAGKPGEVLYKQVNDLLQKHQVRRLIGIGPEINKFADHFDLDFTGYTNVQSFLASGPYFSDELILIKGARDFGLEKIVQVLEERNHGTVLEVNFESILHNLNVYRGLLKPEVKLMVMVKAFAYGVGVEEISHLLQYHQVDYLGVAYLDEAIELRNKGITLPIMIMNASWDSFNLLEAFGLEPEIYSLEMLRTYLAETTNPPPIHLKIETGMNRLGIGPTDLSEVLELLQQWPLLKVAGIFTHFSSADEAVHDAYTQQQAEIFNQAYELLSNQLGYKPIKHALNSVGIVRWPQFQFDMVRLGIGLYGFDSSSELAGLRPISQLKAKISQIKTVAQGTSVGYSRMGVMDQTGQVATISIGYADGYSRLFGNGKAYVMINGQKAKTIGNICMDMTMLDVTGLNVSVGDEVTLFGTKPSIVELASWANTIPYEILTNVSQRVKRIFVSE